MWTDKIICGHDWDKLPRNPLGYRKCLCYTDCAFIKKTKERCGVRKLNGYFFKIDFVGDSITPVYRVRMYKPGRFWKKLISTETYHADDFKDLDFDACRETLKRYKKHCEIMRGY